MGQLHFLCFSSSWGSSSLFPSLSSPFFSLSFQLTAQVSPNFSQLLLFVTLGNVISAYLNAEQECFVRALVNGSLLFFPFLSPFSFSRFLFVRADFIFLIPVCCCLPFSNFLDVNIVCFLILSISLFGFLSVLQLLSHGLQVIFSLALLFPFSNATNFPCIYFEQSLRQLVKSG
jgi:hypothetical protein